MPEHFSIHVRPLGSKVKLHGEIDAIITAVCIRRAHVTYECAWMSGANRKSEWVEPDEIEHCEAATTKIGFRIPNEARSNR